MFALQTRFFCRTTGQLTDIQFPELSHFRFFIRVFQYRNSWRSAQFHIFWLTKLECIRSLKRSFAQKSFCVRKSCKADVVISLVVLKTTSSPKFSNEVSPHQASSNKYGSFAAICEERCWKEKTSMHEISFSINEAFWMAQRDIILFYNWQRYTAFILTLSTMCTEHEL